MSDTSAKASLSSPIPRSGDGFTPPIGPPPRDRYEVRTSAIVNRPGTWNYIHVDVFRLNEAGDTETQVAEYIRNYSVFYETFEPFRQYDGDRYHDYALISRCYTATSVLDLETGQIIAEEERQMFGFCPTQFYVPDWREIHDTTPYSEDFSDEDLAGSDMWWPRSDFGFVAGCISKEKPSTGEPIDG